MNEENKKQMIMLAVLGVVLTGVFVKQFAMSPSTNAAVSTGQTSQAANDPKTASVFEEIDMDIENLGQKISEVKFNYHDNHEGRDPSMPLVGKHFIKLAKASSDSPEALQENLLYYANQMRVTGIIWDKNKPMAVVDEEVVHVGFRFEEPISVKAITRDHVVLTLVGEEIDIVRELKEQ
jgi:hypothetical protein